MNVYHDLWYQEVATALEALLISNEKILRVIGEIVTDNGGVSKRLVSLLDNPDPFLPLCVRLFKVSMYFSEGDSRSYSPL